MNRVPQKAFSFGKNPTSACGNRLTRGQSSASVRYADPITCFNAAADKLVAAYWEFSFPTPSIHALLWKINRNRKKFCWVVCGNKPFFRFVFCQLLVIRQYSRITLFFHPLSRASNWMSALLTLFELSTLFHHSSVFWVWLLIVSLSGCSLIRCITLIKYNISASKEYSSSPLLLTYNNSPPY